MATRALISLTNGKCSPVVWAMALAEEEPVVGKPVGCARCPLRAGGEWDDGASQMVEQAPVKLRTALADWGCHAAHRPCAGMRRILARQENAAR